MSEPAEFEVVVVCSGNRFRSPIAAGVLRDVVRGLPVRVRSVGTLELPPGPALPQAIELARAFDLDLSAHRSRPLEGEDLSGADLVLGFETIHVARAVVDARARRERTFLATELAEYLTGAVLADTLEPVERARAAIRFAHEARTAARRSAQELADPFGGSAADYRRSAESVRTLMLRLAGLLFAVAEDDRARARLS